LGQHLIRNIFDQYTHPENRLTHALVQVLARDHSLLHDFANFATGLTPPKGSPLTLSCQLIPGREERRPMDEDDTDRQGVPDAWIFDDRARWAVLCECKLTAGLSRDELERHISTAQKRGFDSPCLLVITPHDKAPAVVARVASMVPTSWVSWAQISRFLAAYPRSPLVREFLDYMRVVEADLMVKGYDGQPLSEFMGIPFGPDHLYRESEAKVILRALMPHLRDRLERVLAVNPRIRRPALVGVWDVVGFNVASVDQPFTRHPHLTVSITEDANLQLTLPNNAGSKYWAPLRASEKSQLRHVLAAVAEGLRPLRTYLGRGLWEPTLTLYLEQVHFYTPKIGITDGRFLFDLDTILQDSGSPRAEVKVVPAWFDAAHAILAQTPRANFELGIQARFPFSQKSICRRPEFLDTLVAVAQAFRPFLAFVGVPLV
jgi:hypothetical protein